MINTQIKEFESSMERDWVDCQALLKDDFSLEKLTKVCDAQGRNISTKNWVDYFKTINVSKSKIRLVQVSNDNQIEELLEEEIDYVVGGWAAVPVLGAVVVVVGVAALAVAVHIVIAGSVSLVVWATNSVTGPSPSYGGGAFGGYAGQNIIRDKRDVKEK